MAAARSIAQPLTSPDGSNAPPGLVVKYPPVTARAVAHKASTSPSSGAQSPSAISPRPYRLTSLSSRYVENVASTQCSQRSTPGSAAAATSAGTSKEKTVPITCSACRSRSRQRSRRPPGLRPVSGTVVQDALQGLDVTAAGVSSAGDHVDLRTLRRQGLLDELRESEVADPDVVLGALRLLKHRYLRDLVLLQRHLNLDRPIGGVGHIAGDETGGPRGGAGLAVRLRIRRASGNAGQARRPVGLERQQHRQAGDGAADSEKNTSHQVLRSEFEGFVVDPAAGHARRPEFVHGGFHHAEER